MDDWLEGRLHATTQTRYQRARLAFAAWLAKRGFTLGTLSVHEVDVLAARFTLCGLEDGDDVNEGRQFFMDLRASLQKRLGGRLLLTAKVIEEWRVIAPPGQATPLPYEAAFAAAVAMSMVYGEFGCAILTVVCFAGLLRIGEGMGLTVERVIFRDLGHGPEVAVLDLGDTKRGFEEGRVVQSGGDSVAASLHA